MANPLASLARAAGVPEGLDAQIPHYRLLAENASDVVYQTDMQGTIRWISPSVTTS